MASAQNLVSPLMLKLSNYVATTRRRKLESSIATRTKIHLLDTFAAIIAGSQLPPGKSAIRYVRTQPAANTSGLIGTKIMSSSLNAALANGMCGHAAEIDDTHPPSRTHPGTAVVPAVLALAEQEARSGMELLRCIALGYDLCARSMLALAPRAALRPAAVNGAFGHLFGAAAGAAAILGLNARQCRFTLTYAGQQASGLYTRLRDPEHIEKAYAVGGMPAHNAVLAALMVRAGFTGVEDVFSGSDNFFATYAPNADTEALVRELGERHEIKRAGIKPWCAGGPAQAPLDVLYSLLQEHVFSASDVEKLIVHLPATELKIVDNRAMPSISLQHLMALLLVDGTVSFASARDGKRMNETAILALRGRISATVDTSSPNTVRGWSCAMDIELKDGRVLTKRTQAAKGSFENPLSLAEIEEKARGLIWPVLGKRRGEILIRALANIETLDNVQKLRELYRH